MDETTSVWHIWQTKYLDLQQYQEYELVSSYYDTSSTNTSELSPELIEALLTPFEFVSCQMCRWWLFMGVTVALTVFSLMFCFWVYWAAKKVFRKSQKGLLATRSPPGAMMCLVVSMVATQIWMVCIYQANGLEAINDLANFVDSCERTLMVEGYTYYQPTLREIGYAIDATVARRVRYLSLAQVMVDENLLNLPDEVSEITRATQGSSPKDNGEAFHKEASQASPLDITGISPQASQASPLDITGISPQASPQATTEPPILEFPDIAEPGFKPGVKYAEISENGLAYMWSLIRVHDSRSVNGDSLDIAWFSRTLDKYFGYISLFNPTLNVTSANKEVTERLLVTRTGQQLQGHTVGSDGMQDILCYNFSIDEWETWETVNPGLAKGKPYGLEMEEELADIVANFQQQQELDEDQDDDAYTRILAPNAIFVSDEFITAECKALGIERIESNVLQILYARNPMKGIWSSSMLVDEPITWVGGLNPGEYTSRDILVSVFRSDITQGESDTQPDVQPISSLDTGGSYAHCYDAVFGSAVRWATTTGVTSDWDEGTPGTLTVRTDDPTCPDTWLYLPSFVAHNFAVMLLVPQTDITYDFGTQNYPRVNELLDDIVLRDSVVMPLYILCVLLGALLYVSVVIRPISLFKMGLYSLGWLVPVLMVTYVIVTSAVFDITTGSDIIQSCSQKLGEITTDKARFVGELTTQRLKDMTVAPTIINLLLQDDFRRAMIQKNSSDGRHDDETREIIRNLHFHYLKSYKEVQWVFGGSSFEYQGYERAVDEERFSLWWNDDWDDLDSCIAADATPNPRLVSTAKFFDVDIKGHPLPDNASIPVTYKNGDHFGATPSKTWSPYVVYLRPWFQAGLIAKTESIARRFTYPDSTSKVGLSFSLGIWDEGNENATTPDYITASDLTLDALEDFLHEIETFAGVTPFILERLSGVVLVCGETSGVDHGDDGPTHALESTSNLLSQAYVNMVPSFSIRQSLISFAYCQDKDLTTDLWNANWSTDATCSEYLANSETFDWMPGIDWRVGIIYKVPVIEISRSQAVVAERTAWFKAFQATGFASVLLYAVTLLTFSGFIRWGKGLKKKQPLTKKMLDHDHLDDKNEYDCNLTFALGTDPPTIGVPEFIIALPDRDYQPKPPNLSSLQKILAEATQVLKRNKAQRVIKTCGLSTNEAMAITLYTAEIEESSVATYWIKSTSSDFQIYSELNKILRSANVQRLLFWKPFLWPLVMGLQKMQNHKYQSMRHFLAEDDTHRSGCDIDLDFFVERIKELFGKKSAPTIEKEESMAMSMRNLRMVSEGQPILVFRGVDLSAGTYKEGMEVLWRSFSSTSENLSVARSFVGGKELSLNHARIERTLFFIHAHSATPVRWLSFYPEEDEMLFPPGTVFRVTKTGADSFGCFLNDVRFVELEEIPIRARPLINFAEIDHLGGNNEPDSVNIVYRDTTSPSKPKSDRSHTPDMHNVLDIGDRVHELYNRFQDTINHLVNEEASEAPELKANRRLVEPASISAIPEPLAEPYMPSEGHPDVDMHDPRGHNAAIPLPRPTSTKNSENGEGSEMVVVIQKRLIEHSFERREVPDHDLGNAEPHCELARMPSTAIAAVKSNADAAMEIPLVSIPSQSTSGCSLSAETAVYSA